MLEEEAWPPVKPPVKPKNKMPTAPTNCTKHCWDNATRMRARAAQHDYPEPEEPSESEESEGDAHHLRRKLKNGTLLSNNTQSKSK